MGTANAAGYLAGALITRRLIAAAGARGVCLVGMFVSGALLMGHGLAVEVGTLYALRAASGLASAAVFVSGGLMAARLSLRDPLGAGMTPGLVLGLYYGGTGWGIVASALIVAVPDASPASWRDAWRWLGAVSLLAAAVMLWRSRATPTRAVASQAGLPFAAKPFAFALAAYLMFGLGYIGYMTFIVTLLREQGLSTQAVSAFFALLGIVALHLGRAASEASRRASAGDAQRLAGRCEPAARALARGDGGLRVRGAVRWCVPVGRRRHDRAGAAQPPRLAVGGGGRCVHGRIRGWPDPRPERRRHAGGQRRGPPCRPGRVSPCVAYRRRVGHTTARLGASLLASVRRQQPGQRVTKPPQTR